MRPQIGIELDVQPHQFALLNHSLPLLRELRVEHIRLAIDPEQFDRPHAHDRYRRLFDLLGDFQIMPMIRLTRSTLPTASRTRRRTAVKGRADGARRAGGTGGGAPATVGDDPRNALAERVNYFLTHHGDQFDEIQIGDEIDVASLQLPESFPPDPDSPLIAIASRLHRAAACAQRYGKRTILAGLRPVCPRLIQTLGELGALANFDVVAAHVMPHDETIFADHSPFCSFLNVQRRLADATDRPIWITRTSPTAPPTPALPDVRHPNGTPGVVRENDHLEAAVYAPFERIYLHPLLDHPGAPPSTPVPHNSRLVYGPAAATSDTVTALADAHGNPRPGFYHLQHLVAEKQHMEETHHAVSA